MSRHSAFRVLFLATALAVAFILASFGVAAALGLADEERFRGFLAALADQRGRTVAGAAIALLLVVDLALPLPSSVLMMLAGTLLGAPAGFAVAFAGSLGAATLGYALCRRYGKPAFRRVCGEAEAARVEHSLARIGPWLILLTRGAPVLAEVTACLAGLAAMSPLRFVALAALGTAPVAAVYAWSGALARDEVALPLAVGTALPVAGFLVATVALRRRRDGT